MEQTYVINIFAGWDLNEFFNWLVIFKFFNFNNYKYMKIILNTNVCWNEEKEIDDKKYFYF